MTVAGVSAVVASIVVATALVMNHRADEEADKERAAASASAASVASASSSSIAARESEEAEAFEKAQGAFQDCRRQLSPLLNALTEVDARLNVGLSQAELSNFVGEASVAYSRIDVRALGKDRCLFAAARLETALNSYSRTVSTWNDCIFDYYCDVDSIDPELQSGWSKASRMINAARRLLDQMDPTSPRYRDTGGNDGA